MMCHAPRPGRQVSAQTSFAKKLTRSPATSSTKASPTCHRSPGPSRCIVVYATCSLLGTYNAKARTKSAHCQLLATNANRLEVVPFEPGTIPGFDRAITNSRTKNEGWMRVLPGGFRRSEPVTDFLWHGYGKLLRDVFPVDRAFYSARPDGEISKRWTIAGNLLWY